MRPSKMLSVDFLAVAFLVTLSLTLVAASAEAQTQVCRMPALGISDNSTASDNLSFTQELEIQDTEVFIDITHTWIGDLTLVVNSPAGSGVTLHSGQGGSADNMLLTYSDSGIANSTPYTCNCDMQPSSGTLSSFNVENSQGTWTLSVSDGASGDQGLVNEWCVNVTGSPFANFIRGDANGDGNVVGLVDGVFILNYQFTNGASIPPCLEAIDVNDDGSFNGLLDAAHLLNFFFTGGPAPAAPYPACGSDLDDALGCANPPVFCN